MSLEEGQVRLLETNLQGRSNSEERRACLFCRSPDTAPEVRGVRCACEAAAEAAQSDKASRGAVLKRTTKGFRAHLGTQ